MSFMRALFSQFKVSDKDAKSDEDEASSSSSSVSLEVPDPSEDRGGYGGRGGRDRGDRPPPDTSVRGRLRARARKKARKQKKKGGFVRRKVCRYCADQTIAIDYKDPKNLRYFLSETSKLIPARISGNCAKHQRQVSLAIKRGRHLALLPFTGSNGV